MKGIKQSAGGGRRLRARRLFALMLTWLMLLPGGARADAPLFDPSPAVYVAEKTRDSAVGVVAWGPSSRGGERYVAAWGSGVVVREGGYVLTNCHVTQGGIDFAILLPEGSAGAELVGRSEENDIAVLRIVDGAAAEGLKPVEWADMEDVRLGQSVIAVGNYSRETLVNSVTMGVVSGLHRDGISVGGISREMGFLQHDAVINSGSSGGGLFNARGQLVGINTMKLGGVSTDSHPYRGLGFAIPADVAQSVADSLMDAGNNIAAEE